MGSRRGSEAEAALLQKAKASPILTGPEERNESCGRPIRLLKRQSPCLFVVWMAGLLNLFG